MAHVTLDGHETPVMGDLPAVGSTAPDFRLTDGRLTDRGLADFAATTRILTINPSFDTGVCQATAREFNRRAGSLSGTVVLAISGDLPFAQSRFCTSAGLGNLTHLSTFRNPGFMRAYGVELAGGPFAGLPARAVVVIDRQGTVVHSELVPEIAREPDYEAALTAATRA